MIIPSIILPISLELFEAHFYRFFSDFTKKPDYLKYYLTRIEVGKVGFRYIVELEGQDLTTPSKSKRIINEIEALLIDENKTEIRSSTLEPLAVFEEDWSWSDAFIDEFHKMIFLKWDIWPSFPYVNGLNDPIWKVSFAAQAQFDHDFERFYLPSKHPLITSMRDLEGNEVSKENNTLLPDAKVEVIKRLGDLYYQFIFQGLPPIDATEDVSQKSTKRGPVTPTDDEKLKALRDWGKKKGHDQLLEEFLENRFGTENGVLKVAPSTFHGWRRKFIIKGLLHS
jgi:hypothetical protein